MTYDTTPFDTTRLIPEGHYLLKGNFLAATARAAKVQFRLATRPPRKGETATHSVPVGLLLRKQDKPAMDAALERSRLRKAKEAAAREAVRKL